jgi:protein involved in polysaccharide export with SLBB domain
MTSANLRIVLYFTLGLSAWGIALPQPIAAQRANQESVSIPERSASSALDQENSSRVAASAEQIREVLVKDPGLLVELKRFVAAQATSNGQLVDEFDLTDQAIFDRLGDDVVFRAAATRLVQHYGYLLPSINPDSEIGKQQELVLKERARRLVQVESQEDADALKPEKAEDGVSAVDSASGHCNPQKDLECAAPSQRRLRPDFVSPRELPGDTTQPPFAPNQNVQPNNSPLIQTRFSGRSQDVPAGASDSNDLLRLSAMNAPRNPSTLQSSPADFDRYSGLLRSDPSTANARGMRSDSESDKTYRQNEQSASSISRSRRDSSGEPNTDFSGGAIVHKASPYSDIPSFYDLYVQVAARDRTPERFGVTILSTGERDSNEMAMDIPVGPDYVVGPGDGLEISLWGGVSQRLQRTVDHEGRISLPESGPLLVSGRTIGDVQLTIQQLLRTQFRDVSTDVSLSRLRTVRVYVVGEVPAPGAYEVSSLSSALNALIAAGGVTERGSLRSIKHYRGQKLIEVVDAYDLLLRGVGSDQKRLEDGDSLLVPPVGPQVTIEGMVRRPAIYELRGGTSLEDALELAGGILPAAALKHVEVERLVAHENRTMLSLDLTEKGTEDHAASQLQSFNVQDGDRIHIFPIAPYNDQAIYLQGHVLKPGRYSYKDGMTVKDIVTSYADLLPEPSGKYAEIIRLNPPDYRPTVEGFDLTAALADPTKAPQLKPLDTVRIFSKYDFEPAPDVWVGGEVRAPGQYTTSGQAHVRDAIYLARGVTPDADMDSAQILRTRKDGTMQILNVNLGEALSGTTAENIPLEPHDRIVVHRNAATVEPPVVYVKGDVAKPGRFPLTANMRVQDLVRIAGGLKPSAESDNAILTHREGKQLGAAEAASLVVNLNAAMAGELDQDRLLNNGDVLTIRQSPGWNDLGASVTIRGEVQHPGTYGIKPGESLNSVLQKAGGITSQGYDYGIVLTRREVRELEMKSHQELVARVKAEETQLKALPENDPDQKNLKLTAIAQTETTLTQLQTNLPIGRVVIHASQDDKSFERAAEQTPLRNGDVILVPKKPNYVVIQGQVFNATAVGFVPGRSANWYLGQAGGFTQLADKKAVFVIRADGSVLAAKNNNSMWSGNPMDAELMAGDVIVVPEKAPTIGARNWLPLIQSAQVATSVAIAVAYLKP